MSVPAPAVCSGCTALPAEPHFPFCLAIEPPLPAGWLADLVAAGSLVPVSGPENDLPCAGPCGAVAGAPCAPGCPGY
jgi:hypothetical protein